MERVEKELMNSYKKFFNAFDKEKDRFQPNSDQLEEFEKVVNTHLTKLFYNIKEDIKKNGIKTELHITKSRTILCGHQRFRVAKEIGLREVPCKIINIDGIRQHGKSCFLDLLQDGLCIS